MKSCESQAKCKIKREKATDTHKVASVEKFGKFKVIKLVNLKLLIWLFHSHFILVSSPC